MAIFEKVKLVKLGALSAVAIAGVLGGAQSTMAEAATLNMHTYATQTQCQAAVSTARAAGKTINQNCTYAGNYFLWFQLNPGPWIADF